MDNLHLVRELETLLRNDSRYTTEDGTPLKNRIVEDALALRPELLRHLLGHPKLRAHFFADVDGLAVFDKVKFQRFVMNKQFLADSYTAFKNRIGLTTDDGRFLSDSREVVLSWPYKDCLLEGGQTKEDAKRDETFWNETLAPEEVARLTEPKALTAFRRYDKDGAHEVEQVSLADNLVIKGNNLLALHSLKRTRWAGMVKMIYIDPPYYFSKTKAGDSFTYNSNFKLSTWLTFMRDRLIAAYDLLANGGVLLCHIKEDGVHWLKVLMEETFKTENFVETFIWRNTDNPDSLSKKSRSSVEYIICFEKTKNSKVAYKGKETENGDAPLLHTGNNIHELEFNTGEIHFNIADGIYPKGKPDRVELLDDVEVRNGVNANTVRLKGEFIWSDTTKKDEVDNGTYFIVKSNKFSVRFQRPRGTFMAPEKFFDDQYLSKAIGVGTNEDASTHLQNMGVNFKFSKPESVVAYFVRAVTNEGDIVMDFFGGSGTTATVALKMHRRFILVEQMNYIETETVKRLRKAINGEQGGISKAVGWQGGGSFVYCELAKANIQFAEEIERATDSVTLKAIWERMVATGYLNYRVDVATVNAEAESLEALPMEDQRRFMVECLDKNLLYIPQSDLDSDEFTLSDSDRRLTRMFYAKNR